MRNFLFTIIIFVICPFILFSQNYYDITYDFGHYDHPKAFVADEDGNVIVCGWFEDNNFENPKAFVFKVDIDGQEVWRVTLDEASKFNALCIMESGNIAIAGSMNDNCFLSVVDAETGNELWSYEENTSDGYWFGSVNEVTNGEGFQLRPVKTTEGLHTPTIYIFASSNGQLFDQYQRWDVYSPIEFSFQESYFAFWFGAINVVVQTNFVSACPMIWSYGGTHTAGMDMYLPNARVLVVMNGTLKLSLLTYDYNTGVNNSVDLFFDTTDDVEVIGSGVIAFEKILATGTLNGDLSLWIFNNDLTLHEEMIYPYTNPRSGIDVLGLQTNQLVIMGYESLDEGEASDVFLMKGNENGLVSTNETALETNIQIFPNPATDKLFINNDGKQNVEVEIVNCLGQIVKKISNTDQYLSIEDLPIGYYVASIKVDGVMVNQEKLIKQ